MLSVLLQGPGGGGYIGGGGYDGSYGATGGGDCSKTCIIVLSCVFGFIGLLFAIPLILYTIVALHKCVQQCRASRQIKHHKRKATLTADIKAADRSSLFLSTPGRLARTVTTSTTTTYRGHTANNTAERSATFDVTFDSSYNRAITGSGSDSWRDFTVRGSFVLDSLTHGYITFTKAYARYDVQYAGEFDTAEQPLVVRGSWYTAAGTSDGGPFTMKFAQLLTIMDTAPPVAAAVVVDIDAPGIQPKPAPLAAAGSGSAVGAVSDMRQAPPPSYDYQHLSESRSSAGSGVSVSDVEMVAQPPLPHDF